MPVAALDTTVLYAAANASDSFHDGALPIVRGIDDGSLPEARVSEFVLAETLNGITRDVSPEAAVDFLDRLEVNARFSIERASVEVFATGKALFRRHERFSLVDALVVAEARASGIEFLYAFDDDFDGLDGITRLDTAANPFEP